MERSMAGRWTAMDPLAGSLSSSSSDSEENEDEALDSIGNKRHAADLQKKTSVDFEALNRHGYSGGPSILHVPPPKASIEVEQDWSWSSGKRKGDRGDFEEEPFAQREHTHDVANEGALQAASQAIEEYNYAKKQRRAAAAEHRALSFAQKEKRKRNLGQTSRGKNYVEEEKRLLRDSGVYSGFDT